LDPFGDYDPQVDVIALSFATRLLLSDLNRDLMIDRALESLADFGRSERIGIFLLNQAEERLVSAGALIDNAITKRAVELPVAGTPCEEVLQTKKTTRYKLSYLHGVPLPVYESDHPERICLCTPLIAADNRPIGIVTFDHPADFTLSSAMMQPLIVLLTVIAIGLETARLFQLAVFDGLTGLYVRHYFDLRLSEEEARLKRHGGNLALLITDIDHFKHFNDTFGHQQGDKVLRDTSDIMRASIRENLDAPCRYGGEEFAVIMPNTDLAGAEVVANRLCQRCRDNPYMGPDGPVPVTLSGGIAYMDDTCIIPANDLVRLADEALYRAKQNGRDQIQLYKP